MNLSEEKIVFASILVVAVIAFTIKLIKLYREAIKDLNRDWTPEETEIFRQKVKHLSETNSNELFPQS